MNIDYETRDFTQAEVIHHLDGVQQDQISISLIAMGYVQALRDSATKKFNRQVRLKITSGFRNKEHNRKQGGSSGSYHTWRVDDLGKTIFALDVVSPDITLEDLYNFLADHVVGEVYMNIDQNIVHIAPYGPDESWVDD